MHTFSQIAHKTTSETDELYNFSTNINSKNMKFDFCSKAHNHEYVPNLTIPFESDMTNRLMKIFLFMFAVGPIDYSIQSKFSYFKKTIDNNFMTTNQRDEFISRFCKIQRHYWALSRAVYRYKWRKASCRIQNDLILTPISESQHNVVTIFQNNNKYLFTVSDMRTIIEGALSNSPYMFAHPLAPKNPYNNLPFDKATLYHIYFFMKQGNFVLSNLFHNYFLCDFSLNNFKRENEVIIRKKHLDHYVKNAPIGDLYLEAIDMLRLHKQTRRLQIDKDFPASRFVEIMRPYLALYYSQIYSLDLAERDNSEYELKILLRRFAMYNPRFGKKCFRIVKGKPNEMYFLDDHIKFQRINRCISYQRSHIDFTERDNSDLVDRIIRQSISRETSIIMQVNDRDPSEEGEVSDNSESNDEGSEDDDDDDESDNDD